MTEILFIYGFGYKIIQIYYFAILLFLISFLSDLVFANKVLLVSMLGKIFCEVKRGFFACF